MTWQLPAPVRPRDRSCICDFNAKKSGILVFGESRREHDRNSMNCAFTLGPERVRERVTYEHVGINVSIFPMIPRV